VSAEGSSAALLHASKELPGCPVPSPRSPCSDAERRPVRGSAPFGLAQASQGFDGTGQPGSAGSVGTKGVPCRFDAKRPCRAGVEQRAWQWKQATSSTV